MNKRVEIFLEKVNTPEYQKRYLQNTAPKIANIFGATGKWWNKWHAPENLWGTICPVCAIKGCDNQEWPDFLKQNIGRVTTTKIGHIIEDYADKLVRNMLLWYNKKMLKNKSSNNVADK